MPVVDGLDDRVAAGRHAGRRHHLLGERLRALQPRRPRRRAEAGDARRGALVGQAGDERRLRARRRRGPCRATSPSGTIVASRAMPALPGAAKTSGRCGERFSARTIACSRPPPPTTRTVVTSERGDEVVDRDRGERLVVGGAARAELERDARHRLLVGRLDDVHEVEVAERRPLRLDRGAELLDLLVDLADARRGCS